MKKQVICIYLVIFIFLAVSLTGCATDKEIANKIRIGYFPSVSHAPAIIGWEKGLFSEELPEKEFDFKSFPNGSLFMDALSTGQIDVGYVGPGPVINRYLQGGDVLVLAGVSHGENVLAVRKNMKLESLRDLEGKIIATASTGCTHDLILRKMLQEEGLAVEENGGTVKRIAQQPATTIGLLQQKQIDGAVVSEPWASIMEARGVADIVRDAKELPWNGNLPATILVARRSFLEANPELWQSLTRANEKAIEFINHNSSEAASIVSKRIKETTNEEIGANIIIKSMKRVVFSPNLDKKTLQEFADLSKELGFIEGTSSLEGLYKME